MLLTIDRVQIATPDAKSAAEMWRRRLGAEQVSADRVRGLGAKRLTLRAGTGDREYGFADFHGKGRALKERKEESAAIACW